jgi:biopolymer transport protein ExbB/TolQ
MNDINLSLLDLFIQATVVVQGVLLLLLAASLLGWSVIIEKALTLRRLGRQAGSFEQLRASLASRPQTRGDGLAGELQQAGLAEIACPHPGEHPSDARDRVERSMRESLAAVLMQAEQRLGYLATIGSAAPFIGLFGTVWGIMHAFAGIARHHDTSLAAVAPGIAEALAATAIGLVTAIPAAIAYNKLAGDFSMFSRRMNLGIARFARQLVDLEGAP